MTDGEPTPDDRATTDDASVPARNTLPDPELQSLLGAQKTLPEIVLGDDISRDTAIDVSEPAVDPEDAPPAPKTVRRSWVYLLVGGLLFAALAGPLLFYFFVWRYRPTAVQHIPAGTTAAIRFDGNELYLFAPFRENVLSVFDDAQGTADRAEHLKSVTGIDVRKDVREVVVATTSGDGYVVLLGGQFQPPRLSQDRFVPGLQKFFTEEGVLGFSLDGDVLVGHGVRIAQADDSTIIIATHQEGLAAAMDATDAWTKLGLASSGAASFVVDRPALSAVGRSLPPGSAAALTNAEKLTGYVMLGDSPTVYIDLIPHEGTEPEALAKNVDDAVDGARVLTLLLPDSFGEKDALASVKVKPRAKSVMIEASWPKSGLEKATQLLGSALRTVFAKPQP